MDSSRSAFDNYLTSVPAIFVLNWRRGRDSNPGWSYPHNCLAGSCLQPLGHLSPNYKLKNRIRLVSNALPLRTPNLILLMMAEREGFEPPELSLNGFQDRRLKPLGHLSDTISPDD